MSERWMAEIDGEKYEITPILRISKKRDKSVLEQMMVTQTDENGNRMTLWAEVPTVETEAPSSLIGLDGRPVRGLRQ